LLASTKLSIVGATIRMLNNIMKKNAIFVFKVIFVLEYKRQK
jgi:hypothetical protein